MSGLRLLSEAVPKITGRVFSRKYTMLGRLVTNWEDIVGRDLAGKAQPVKIHYRKRKANKDSSASLDIAATTADATVLHYKKDLILERINQIFGDRWITAIRFVPLEGRQKSLQVPQKRIKKPLSAEQKEELEATLARIADPDIKAKLEKLGKAVLQDEPS